jgi:hypothetical protein
MERNCTGTARLESLGPRRRDAPTSVIEDRASYRSAENLKGIPARQRIDFALLTLLFGTNNAAVI